MWYIILFIGLIILAIAFYSLFNKEVLSPTFITCLVYAMSTMAAFISYLFSGWNNVNIQANTAIFILLGVVAFGVGELIYRKQKIRISKKKTIEESDSSKKEKKEINVGKKKSIVALIFIVLTLILIFSNMQEITGKQSIPEVINAYKKSSIMYNQNQNEVKSIRTIYTQMYRFSIAIGLVFLYIVMNNFLFKKIIQEKLRTNALYIVIVVITMTLAILLGGRSSIMQFVVAAFTDAVIITMRSKKILIKKFLKVGAIILVIALPTFYLLLGAIGQTTKSSFGEYITFYLGCPLPSFDKFLNASAADSAENQPFGYNTFTGFQQILKKLHIINYYNIYQDKTLWIDYGNGLSSNVYTSIKCYIQDFGLLGMIILQILAGLIFTRLYGDAKYKGYNATIFYGIINAMVIDQYRSEKIFHAFFRIDTLVYFISIIIITYFLFNIKFKKFSIIFKGRKAEDNNE